MKENFTYYNTMLKHRMPINNKAYACDFPLGNLYGDVVFTVHKTIGINVSGWTVTESSGGLSVARGSTRNEAKRKAHEYLSAFARNTRLSGGKVADKFKKMVSDTITEYKKS